MKHHKSVLHVFVHLFCIQNHVCHAACMFFETGKQYVIAEENSTVTVEFSIHNTCQTNSATLKTVQVLEVQEYAHGLVTAPICLFENGSCIGSFLYQDCVCHGENKRYTIKRTIRGRPRAVVWNLNGKLTNEKGFSAKVTILIQYPPEIVAFTITNDNIPVSGTAPASINTSVNITCVWKEGNPAQHIRLKKNDVELIRDETDGYYGLKHMSYVIERIKCSDAGTVTCGTEGLRVNRTRVLHIRCGPQFVSDDVHFISSSSEHLLQFSVHAFDNSFNACHLWKHNTEEGNCNMKNTTRDSSEISFCKGIDCTQTATMTGSFPNLTLYIQLQEMIADIKGKWRLDLTNQDGTMSFNFTIDWIPRGEVINNIKFIVILAIASCVFTLLIVACMCRLTKCKGHSYTLPAPNGHNGRHHEVDAVVLRRISPADCDCLSVVSTDPYAEALDDTDHWEFDSFDGVNAEEHAETLDDSAQTSAEESESSSCPTPTSCSGTTDDLYLHPIASPLELSDTANSANARNVLT